MQWGMLDIQNRVSKTFVSPETNTRHLTGFLGRGPLCIHPHPGPSCLLSQTNVHFVSVMKW